MENLFILLVFVVAYIATMIVGAVFFRAFFPRGYFETKLEEWKKW